MSADYPEDYPPPPSYDETVSAAARQPPFPRPESLKTHRITVGPGAASLSLPFPDPADFWQGRDITSQDWASFASDITAALASDVEVFDDKKQVDKDAYQKRRVNEIVALWNSRFFERRGLTVVLNGTEEGAGPSADGASRFSFGPDRYGVKIGGGIFGVDFSSSKTSQPKK